MKIIAKNIIEFEDSDIYPDWSEVNHRRWKRMKVESETEISLAVNALAEIEPKDKFAERIASLQKMEGILKSQLKAVQKAIRAEKGLRYSFLEKKK